MPAASGVPNLAEVTKPFLHSLATLPWDSDSKQIWIGVQRLPLIYPEVPGPPRSKISFFAQTVSIKLVSPQAAQCIFYNKIISSNDAPPRGIC